jgi:hypothetical protein
LVRGWEALSIPGGRLWRCLMLVEVTYDQLNVPEKLVEAGIDCSALLLVGWSRKHLSHVSKLWFAVDWGREFVADNERWCLGDMFQGALSTNT